MQPPTRADIARHTGYHISTIDRATNPTRADIDPTTRQTILAAIQELGYDPDTARQRAWQRDQYRSLPYSDLAERFPPDTTLTDIARTCGVARETISRSRKRGRIPWFTAERIADHLGHHPTDIWGPAYWQLFEEAA